MAALTVEHERVEVRLDFPVIIAESESAAEQRRLRTNKITGEIQWKSPVLSSTKRDTLISFFKARNGALEAFTWTNPADDTSYNVRFIPDTFKLSHIGGAYRIKFNMKIIDVVA